MEPQSCDAIFSPSANPLVAPGKLHMSKLILIGGPPAVGKTSLRGRLDRAFESAAFLDADDVWRVKPFEVTEQNPINNVLSVLRSYLEAQYPLVFLTWVLANPQLINRILLELEGLYESSLVIHLVASEPVLRERCAERDFSAKQVDYSVLKLSEINNLQSTKIDTTDLSEEAVVDRIAAEVHRFAT